MTSPRRGNTRNAAAPRSPRSGLARLTAGFEAIETWLSDEPTRFKPGAPFEEYLATVALRDHVARLGDPAGREFVRQVAARLPEAEVHYIRLNIVARRAG